MMDKILAFLTTIEPAISSVKDISLIIGGLFGLEFIRRRAHAQNKSAEAAKKQAGIAEKGALTDRFIKSIDQLGSDSIEIRLGGIYGLEKLAQDSKDLYEQIIEVFTAFVRENATDTSYETEELDDKDEFIIIPHKRKTDVQAVITILGKRPETEDASQIDFSYAFLSEYKFIGNFKKTLFWSTNCTKAYFTEANCTEAIFGAANCTKATFAKANCTEAYFAKANCTEAYFAKANCTKTIFWEANCTGATFWDANCTGATFMEANCTRATFMEANCTGATFMEANCTGTDFEKAEGLTEDQMSLSLNQK